jgi:hypothetical protein
MGCGGSGEDAPVNIAAVYHDAGTLDTHAAHVDWGDGDTSAGVVTGGGGSGLVSASHRYTQGGIFTISMTMVDDDTGTQVAWTNSLVTGVGVNAGVLQIVGTEQDDQISVQQQGSNWFLVHASFLPDQGNMRQIPSDGIERRRQ